MLDFIGSPPAMPFGATAVRVDAIDGSAVPWTPLELAYAQGTVLAGTGTVPSTGGETGFDQPFLLASNYRTLLIFDHTCAWSWDLRVNSGSPVVVDATAMTSVQLANGTWRTGVWLTAPLSYGPNTVEVVLREPVAPSGEVALRAAVVEVDANPDRRW